MPITCKVEFEKNPSAVFYSGQVLRGTIHLTTTEEKVFGKASVKIVGNGSVSFTESIPGRRYEEAQKAYVDENQTVERKREETYLSETTHFINGEVKLMPGTYHYPFECALPPNLPTSFDGTHGYIRYMVHVEHDAKSHGFDEWFGTPFTVTKANDLSLDPKLLQPVVAKEVRSLGRWFYFWKSDAIDITANLTVGGYLPGQIINVDIITYNKSNSDVSQFKVALIKNITYEADGHQKCEEVVVVEKPAPGCLASQNKEVRLNITVPSTQPTEVSAGAMIKIQYCVQIKAFIGSNNDAVLVLPVTIGNNTPAFLRRRFSSDEPLLFNDAV